MAKGGKRKGAGRPPLGVEKIYVTLDSGQVMWLKSTGNASQKIRSILEEKMKTTVYDKIKIAPYFTTAEADLYRGMAVPQIEKMIKSAPLSPEELDDALAGYTVESLAQAIWDAVNAE